MKVPDGLCEITFRSNVRGFAIVVCVRDCVTARQERETLLNLRKHIQRTF